MKYKSYKDSKIDWLGDVPNHWTNHRIDWIGELVRGNTGFKKDELLESGEYVALQYGKTYQVDEVNNDFQYYVNSEFYKKNQVVNQGDTILISTSETIEDLGHSCFYNKEELGLLGGEQILFKPNRKVLIGKYLYYFSKKFSTELQKYATGLKVFRFNIDDLKQIFIAIPPIEEQKAIAEYLDNKSQAIDKKVSLLEKKIGYYQELRKSLINETVSKGLNKNAELHINELGFATPKEWLRYRLKDLGSLYSGLSGKSGDDFNQDDNPDNKGFIPFTNIANNTYLKRDHLGTVVVYEGEKQNRVRKGDIFFLMSSEGYEDIGKSAALAEDIEETYLNSFCKGYRVNSRKTNPYFLNYLMLSDYYRQLLIVEGKGFTRINLKMEKVNDFFVYIPDSFKEQEEIVSFLDAKLDTIAKIIENMQKQIITLKELRKALINDVVTGKIKVLKD
ncbi:MAG: restriction endonuclease subunit S [Crocinitomicaceae bacterium]|nr:restriction endonuclease subunit S [Crocinitomicaceae bacterium]